MNSAENVSDEELGRFIRRASLKRFSFAQEAYRIAIALQALRSPPTEDGDRVEVWGTAWQTSHTGDEWHFARKAEFGSFDVERGIVKNVTPLYASPRPETVGVSIDELAQEIRRVDGDNSLGAGALAEALMPFLQVSPQEGE